MSRCFPFPPPGYEKKPRPEEDLLKEEKCKEKNQKKDKKDKEKRESKDKSDGKHKQKDKKEKHRDKKEKHRDKRKDKEKDKYKDKEKSSISEDASVAGQPETRSGEKLHTRAERPKHKSNGSDEKNFASQFQGQNGQNFIDNRLLAGEIEESKFVQELGRRIRDEEKAVGSKPIERSSGADWRGNQETHRFPVRDSHNFIVRDSHNFRDKARFGGNTIVQNLTGLTERKVEGMPGPVQQDRERSIEEKDKSKGKGDDKRGEKRRDKDKKDKDKKDKKSHGKDKGREKDKKKEEKTKEGTEHKKNDQERSKELYRNDNISHFPTDNNKHLTTAESLKKRKHVETNGFMHENEVKPNKLSRPTSHQLPENGRILEACQIPNLLASDKQGVASQDRMDNKERRVNGSTEAPPLYVSKQKPPSAATRSDQVMEALKKPLQADQVLEASRKLPQAYQLTEASKKHRQADQIAEPSRKPPHPDLKYLSQVLSIPKMEEWSEVDDQEWLSSSKGPPSQKPEVGSSGEDAQPRVWSEALHIESAEIYALPYVIPY